MYAIFSSPGWKIHLRKSSSFIECSNKRWETVQFIYVDAKNLKIQSCLALIFSARIYRMPATCLKKSIFFLLRKMAFISSPELLKTIIFAELLTSMNYCIKKIDKIKKILFLIEACLALYYKYPRYLQYISQYTQYFAFLIQYWMDNKFILNVLACHICISQLTKINILSTRSAGWN